MNENNVSSKKTRLCVDPWEYIEVSTSGGLLPCCNYTPLASLSENITAFDQILVKAPFQDLRTSLLNGELTEICQSCHIRKMGTVDELHKKLSDNRHSPTPTSEEKRIAPRQVRIDLTTRCNLRCDYCAVSAPGYAGFDMEELHFDQLVRLVSSLPKSVIIHLNGHGETTYHPNWLRAASTIIDAGHRPWIITNLAKKYSDDEIVCLAKFGVIQISIDSVDSKMMQKIRKPVRLNVVLDNIIRIKDFVSKNKIISPSFSFSVGLYDPAIWKLYRLAQFAVKLRINQVTFWNLVPYGHQKLVRSVANFDEIESAEAKKTVQQSRALLESSGINVVFAGDFIDAQGNSILSTETSVVY